jgi:dienelactone hydrolase
MSEVSDVSIYRTQESAVDAPLLTYTTSAIMFRCSTKSALTQSIRKVRACDCFRREAAMYKHAGVALSGGLDDWTPAAPCVALANMPANRLMTVQVYPGAYHAFDIPGMPTHYQLGHMEAYDAAATADARARALAFLAQYLH